MVSPQERSPQWHWMAAVQAAAGEIETHAQAGIAGGNWRFDGGQVAWMIAGVAGVVPALKEHDLVLLIDAEDGHYRMSLLKKAEVGGEIDIVGAMVSEKARNRLIKRWYEELYLGYTGRDQERGAMAFRESAMAMGIDPLVERGGEQVSIFSGLEPGWRLQEVLKRMERITRTAERYQHAFSDPKGLPTGENIFKYMEALWVVFGELMPGEQEEWEDMSPGRAKQQMAGTDNFGYEQ